MPLQRQRSVLSFEEGAQQLKLLSTVVSFKTAAQNVLPFSVTRVGLSNSYRSFLPLAHPIHIYRLPN